jgi:hypothetical protein
MIAAAVRRPLAAPDTPGAVLDEGAIVPMGAGPLSGSRSVSLLFESFVPGTAMAATSGEGGNAKALAERPDA